GFRGLTLPVQAGQPALTPFGVLGQRMWEPGSPAGWPDRSADWDGASALMKRIEWADALGQRLGNRRDAAALAPQLLGANLSAATRGAVAHAASAAQALTLLLAAPASLGRLPAAVLRGARADRAARTRQPLPRALAFRRPGRSGERLAAGARAHERLAQSRAGKLPAVRAGGRGRPRSERAPGHARTGGGDFVVGIETRRAG